MIADCAEEPIDFFEGRITAHRRMEAGKVTDGRLDLGIRSPENLVALLLGREVLEQEREEGLVVRDGTVMTAWSHAGRSFGEL